MIHTLQCPNCHASLDYENENHSATMRCAYCNSTIIVPESLRGGVATTSASAGLDPEQGRQLAEIERLLAAGRKIEAIKLFRETFQVGLREAKEAVEALERGEPFRLATRGVPASEGSSGRGVACVMLLVLLSLGVAGAVWLLLLPAGQIISDAEQVSVLASDTAVEPSDQTLPFAELLPAAGTAGSTLATLVMEFGGEEGIGPGFFNDTRWIGVDAQGNIYTGDYSGGRVQVFDPGGNFLAQWTVRSDLYMTGMAVDRQGVVYVIDRNRIARYEGLSGQQLTPPALGGSENFRLVAAAPDGNMLFAGPERLVRIDPRDNVTLDLAAPFANIAGLAANLEFLATDGAGAVYVIGRDSVYHFDGNGAFVNRIGSRGDGPDQFRSTPRAMAVDGRGRLFVNDFNGILVFDNNGRYLESIPFRGVAFDMVFNDRNELLVMDRNGNRVVKYALSGR